MPLHRLEVAPADVSGAGLGLALDAPAPAPLATHRISHPGHGAVLLGVLGASHVISVDHPNRSFSEEISCGARSRGGGLPGTADAPGYHLDASTVDHGWADFRRIAGELRGRCHRNAGWLGGTFPGDDAALTAISAVAHGDGWKWRTWHLYPCATGGSVVYTESTWHP